VTSFSGRNFLISSIIFNLSKKSVWEPGWLSFLALGYGLDDREFESRQGLGIFLSTIASRPALEPTQPPIQWVLGVLSLEVKRPGCEADYSLPSSAEFRECVELYIHSPNTPSWRGGQLEKSTGTTLHLRRLCTKEMDR
jgi:hypothetical protein